MNLVYSNKKNHSSWSPDGALVIVTDYFLSVKAVSVTYFTGTKYWKRNGLRTNYCKLYEHSAEDLRLQHYTTPEVTIQKKAKAQVLGIAPLNMRSTCQQRFTIVEVVTDQHWL